MKCNCKDWEKYIPHLEGAISLAWVHGMWGADFRSFKYCPYCGKKLIKDEIKEKRKANNSNK